MHENSQHKVSKKTSKRENAANKLKVILHYALGLRFGNVCDQNATKTQPKRNQNATKTQPKRNQNATKTHLTRIFAQCIV